ncbi:pyruvate dehydrogenase E1 component subunit alpha [Novosphingobium indicum]|uniref:Pyruvate dehydrogenase E1 component subunit alpha n=1 Tax=Novosphingobium indicum TaxID=462949 RepID=A0ABQ2K1M4_9SPHN|nr:thiamine pyrophosphate-dependent dehydrogenase E1 component subunit alpha [Novosphingobium indicum]GGN61703.1 pyruvate dehydrogenase E1 component subunit alpha [Novosphingobium indicum]
MADPINGAIARQIYEKVALLKANDERARKVLKAGQLVMPYYSYRGQELIPAAVSTCLREDDYICTIYRGIHDMLAKGMPLKQLWAEIAGRATGICKGKGGPMHLTYPDKGIMVTTGIVGSSLPIANGLGWASQLSGDGRVAVAYFGDGASNIGAFHESLNLASVWKLPVVFVCQNNLYAEHTTYEKGTSAKQVSDRAFGYSMPGVRCDGNDAGSIHAAAREAIERARSGEGPTLIEAMTFRFHGHVYGDADSYMDPALKEAAMTDDPAPRLRAQVIASDAASEAEMAALEARIESEIDEAVAFALASAPPGPEELEIDIFAEEVMA